jgi:uncharacterized ion transporter superfamily protein YfcC
MKNFKIPHVFIFLFWIIIFCALLTYFIPSGSFERTIRDFGGMKQTVVVPNSYKEIPKYYSVKGAIIGENEQGKSSPVSVLGVLSAIPKGMAESAVLVFYVFIIGAVFTLIHRTGAINAFLFALIDRFRKRPKLLLFLIYMTIFSGSSFMGIGPETIALIPVFFFLSKSLGYDRLFGMGLLIIPISLGWSTGVTNPFTVQIAQVIAELPIGSGIEMRLLMYLVYATLGFFFLIQYGKRVKKNPSRSLMKNDPFNLDDFGSFEKVELKRKHIYILLFFVLSYASILLADLLRKWNLKESTFISSFSLFCLMPLYFLLFKLLVGALSI